MAIQPILAGVLGFVVFPLVEYASRSSTASRASDPLDAAVAFSLGVAIVAFAVTVLGVLPIVAWRLGRGPFTLKEILLAGLLLGNAPGLLITAPANLHRQTTSSPLGSTSRWCSHRRIVLRTHRRRRVLVRRRARRHLRCATTRFADTIT